MGPPYIPRKTVIHPVIVMKRTVMMAVKAETNCETCTGSISRINFQLKNGIETLPVNLSMQIYLFVKGGRNIFMANMALNCFHHYCVSCIVLRFVLSQLKI